MKFSILILIIGIFIMLPSVTHAQGSDPGCDPLDPACPIDGGVYVLLAIGAIYGMVRFRNMKKVI